MIDCFLYIQLLVAVLAAFIIPAVTVNFAVENATAAARANLDLFMIFSFLDAFNVLKTDEFFRIRRYS